MEISQKKGIIEAILFAAGREVKVSELMSALEASSDEIITLVDSLKADYQNPDRGLQIIYIGDAYQLCSKKEYYEYMYAILDKRNKPNLSQAALETLAIIAYNPRITRAEIEAIRRSKFRWNHIQIIRLSFNRRNWKTRCTRKARNLWSNI